MSGSDREVIVVGGGLGGLFVASELARRGVDVVVLDAASRPGGVARTVRDGGWCFEPAASSLILPDPNLSEILEWAGVAVDAALPGARRRLVHDGERLVDPSRPWSLLGSSLIGLRGAARALAEPMVRSRRSGDETLDSFLCRRFGPEAGTVVGTLAARGVYATEPYLLSAEAAYPELTRLEEEHGSLVLGMVRRARERRRSGGVRAPRAPHAVRGGMAAFASALAARLDFRGGWRVLELVPSDGGWFVRGEVEELRGSTVVVAVAPVEASGILPSVLRSASEGFRSTPVTVVGLGGRAADLPLPMAFGALTGPKSRLRMLGVLFESSYLPDRAPEGRRLAKLVYGGPHSGDVHERSDEEAVDLAVRDLSGLLKWDVVPEWSYVARIQPGIPLYSCGHSARVRDLERLGSDLPPIHFAGWGYRGAGVGRLAAEAHRIAEAICSGRERRVASIPRRGLTTQEE